MAYRNIYVNPILRLIYFFLRVITWISVRLLYRRRLLLGREHLRFDGPAIVIVNHPSTLMDVLNPALYIWQEMFFLANYGMFKNPVAGWILRRFFCIPVKRKEDVTEGSERNNLQAFEQSFQHLEKNGVLFIAVEGTSWMNRFVRPLKSGVARIAFGAEARNNWQLGVKIIPIGLSYSAADLFRSDLVINVGAPVNASDWAEQWQEKRQDAVQNLLNHLENQLKTLSIHTRDEAGELLITRLEEILQNENPLPQKAAFERSQGLTQTALDDAALQTQTAAYFEKLQQHELDDAVVHVAKKPALKEQTFWFGLGLLFGFPLFALGYATWFLPCFVPWFLNKKMGLYVGYSTTVKMLVGLFSFPPAIWAVYKLGVYGSGIPVWGGLAALVAAVLLGYFVERYQDLFKKFVANRRAMRLATGEPGLLRELLERRAAVLQQITPES